MDIDPTKLVTWPHTQGVSRCAFTPNGHLLYTAGAEGYIRVFDTDPAHADEGLPPPLLIDFHEEPNFGLSCSNDFVCSANESGLVVLHRHGVITEIDSILTRCSEPVRSARFDPKGQKIAVASDELIVKVIDINDPVNGIQLLPGHRKGVREATWSPDGQLLTTSGQDGQIRVWDFTSGSEPTCIQTLEGVIEPNTDPASEYSIAVVWHPSSKYFVVPSKTREVAIYSRESWSKIGVLSPPSTEGTTAGMMSSLAFSNNGVYLATAMNDWIHVWNFTERKIVTSTQHTQGIVTDMAFQPTPTTNMLAYAHSTGQFTIWKDVIPSTMAKPTWSIAKARQMLLARSEREERETSESVTSKVGEDDGKGDDYFGDDLDGWLDDDEGLMQKKDEYGMDEDRDGGDSRMNGVISKYERAGGDRISSTRYLTAGASSSNSYSYTQGQPSFQPGSTPFREKRRYLAFNMLGLIHAVDRDDQNLVTIEFHDRSAQTGTHFNDSFKFTMGALGELGSAFAVKGTSDSPSLVYYKPFESWTTTQEWQYSLPQDENVIALSVGGIAPEDLNEISIAGTGTVVVATDRGYVRFFSGSGLQKYVWNLGDSVVSIAAGKDWALIVYRSGSSVPDLTYVLVDTDSFEVLQQGKMPLMQGVSLAWIGLTDEQIPAMYDSRGVFSVLDRSRRPRQARWVPVLETSAMARRENKQETYWPIGLTAQHAHVIFLKGEESHPHFPTPLIQELDLQLPLLRLDVQQGQLEEKYLRETTFVSHRRDGASADDYDLTTTLARQELEVDKHLLMAIQTACKAERLEQALDATLLLSQKASLIAAAKIARFFNLPGLEERIQIVQEVKEAEGDGAPSKVREGKWSHLIDERNVRGSGGFGGRSNDSNINVFAMGSKRSMMAPSSSMGMASVAPSYRDSSMARRPIDSQYGESLSEPVGEDDEEMMDDLRASKRARSPEGSGDDEDLYESPVAETVEAVPAHKKKASNPFRRRTPPPAGARTPVSPANPFASKKTGASKAADLHRTGSFFSRVEGTEAPKVKVKRAAPVAGSSSVKTQTVPGTKQTTLFGFATVVEEDNKASAPKGKKRKSTNGVTTREDGEADNDDADLPTPFAKPLPKLVPSTAGLGGHAKELPREGDEFEETQVETQEESLQPINKARSSARKASPVDDAEDEMEATQLEDTQILSVLSTCTKENVGAVTVPPTTASKLSKYRMVAPVAPASVAVEPMTEPVEIAIEQSAVEEATAAE
ncbi:BZ3500_MvSof-1268-A1-R1_Chr8-2g10273 [Microbotryum saponariae]|uniref:BZ3500_MvSof-1268-A1-R1_Chr8-2g10273 protein n=1 Tax=Microbotryum saponariae TaxID=289078 RepID=A0A2X0MV83_9BASI|nr:BZ3500_MvSof-1268-A1-R1_Chr8-2g10273 [Microbotryum saponariae]SDA02071.1 BZ3501_MvSof-1269-A2-R1_Chr8-2g10023 [Microbotryum saponariae]